MLVITFAASTEWSVLLLVMLSSSVSVALVVNPWPVSQPSALTTSASKSKSSKATPWTIGVKMLRKRLCKLVWRTNKHLSYSSTLKLSKTSNWKTLMVFWMVVMYQICINWKIWSLSSKLVNNCAWRSNFQSLRWTCSNNTWAELRKTFIWSSLCPHSVLSDPVSVGSPLWSLAQLSIGSLHGPLKPYSV